MSPWALRPMVGMLPLAPQLSPQIYVLMVTPAATQFKQAQLKPKENKAESGRVCDIMMDRKKGRTIARKREGKGRRRRSRVSPLYRSCDNDTFPQSKLSYLC